MSPKDIRAYAVCGECGCRRFKLFIYACGHALPHCAKCGTYWEAPFRGGGQDAKCDQTVGEARDE